MRAWGAQGGQGAHPALIIVALTHPSVLVAVGFYDYIALRHFLGYSFAMKTITTTICRRLVQRQPVGGSGDSSV